MAIMKTMTNAEIYTTAISLMEDFSADLELPVKINFYLQKNIKTIVNSAKEIEEQRSVILQKYGTPGEDGNTFTFAHEVAEIANKELEDLFNCEQELRIYVLDLSVFDGIVLSTKQMKAIEFMIKDGDEE